MNSEILLIVREGYIFNLITTSLAVGFFQYLVTAIVGVVVKIQVDIPVGLELVQL